MVKKNIVKKNVKPIVVVDFTDCTSISEVYTKSAETVLKKFCTNDEIKSYLAKYGLSIEFHICDCGNCEFCKKKPNIFKRFWNWLTK